MGVAFSLIELAFLMLPIVSETKNSATSVSGVIEMFDIAQVWFQDPIIFTF